MESGDLLDLNNQDSWNTENATQIAVQLGFAFNPEFIKAVDEFTPWAQSVEITKYLGILGERHLKEHKPPLERIQVATHLSTIPAVRAVPPQPANKGCIFHWFFRSK